MNIVALYGHGFLGTAIAEELDNRNIPFRWRHHGEMPLEHFIIDAAGYTGVPNVDGCEDNRLECGRGNILWPLSLHRHGAVVVHIGSGCVYSGVGPYTENTEPNFTGSFYSLTKALEQEALAPYLAHNSYLLRIRMPFSGKHHQKNLFNKLAMYPRLVNHTNSMTRLEDAARAAVRFITKCPEPGIYNCTNPGTISTRQIADALHLTPDWFESNEAFEATVKVPRSQCTLDTTKLGKVMEMPSAQNALAEAAVEWLKGG